MVALNSEQPLSVIKGGLPVGMPLGWLGIPVVNYPAFLPRGNDQPRFDQVGKHAHGNFHQVFNAPPEGVDQGPPLVDMKQKTRALAKMNNQLTVAF